jgi:hypothetical protein
MKVRAKNIFTTVRAEGAILPTDLLQRIVDNDNDLDGLTPAAYHLLEGEKLNEAINRSWSRLRGAWASFQGALERLPESDAATKVTRDRILLPLFQELGYGRLTTTRAIDIEGKAYPISHLWQNTPIHLVGYRVDLDKRTAGVAGAARSSPHSLVQEFLNRSDEHLWAFVSNGRRLRILRDNASLTRQAYVEFDLEAMMAGEVYADFVLLWLLCHQSRVEVRESGVGNRESGAASTPDSRLSTPQGCWLEKWSKTANDQGKRALEALRDGVESAIASLGQGFLTHSANRTLRQKLQSGELATQDYYRQLLRLVYRLLFLFVAEDRELLLDPNAEPTAKDRYTLYYSTARLRTLAEKRRGTRHSDLFHGLRLVMEKLGSEHGCPELALPALGSFLWSSDAVADLLGKRESGVGNRLQENTSSQSPDSPLPTPDSPSMAPCELANADLLDAIRALAFITDKHGRRPVDYKNLQSEELGSVYESLLELHPELNISTGTFSLKTASGNERKTTGSYYTPESLVQCLLDSALDPVIEDTIKTVLAQELDGGNRESGIGNRESGQGKTSSSPDSPLPTPDSPSNPVEDALLNLKICDPACGSGHFLIAAAHRLAKRLAFVRTGDEEPAPEATQTALRDVIGRCIYGVDVNPMAVELCKVALWMEALEPGKPLSFLDHHIQCGNSLLGATPALLRQGIPDDAFKPIEGDDKAYCTKYKKQNKEERKGQLSLLTPDLQPWERLGDLATSMAQVDDISDDDYAGVQRKRQQYEAIVQSTPYLYSRFWADAWCAAFVWIKRPPSEGTANSQKANSEIANGEIEDPLFATRYSATHSPSGFPYPITEEVFRRIERNPHGVDKWMRDEVERLRDQYQFFHWHLAFPDVFQLRNGESGVESRESEDEESLEPGWDGGFDVVLGNPPWEIVEISEKEFFMSKAPDISNASTARKRQDLIRKLEDDNPALFIEFNNAKRETAAYRHLIQNSGRLPLSSTGRINLYPLFVENFAHTLKETGLSGIIVPSAISMDAYNAKLFRWIVENQSLVTLFDFENKKVLFPNVHSSYRFCILTISGIARQAKQAKFCYFCHDPSEIRDPLRRVEISTSEIKQFSPNTLAPPILLNAKDSELAKSAYSSFGILKNKLLDDKQNSWGVSIQRMLSLSDPGDLFRKITELESPQPSEKDWFRVYSGRTIHQFDHRYSSFEGKSWRALDELEYKNSSFFIKTEYYVRYGEVPKRLNGKYPNNYLFGYRDICRSTDERTAIAAIVPKTGCEKHCRNIYFHEISPTLISCFLSNFNSFALDYFCRQKVISTGLGAGVLEQLPFLPLEIYQTPKSFLDGEERPIYCWILNRTVELTYTAWDLQPFAQDCGYEGPPFKWNEDRRFLLRCELDAAYFHLYGIQRDDVDYIMETFPIVKRKDEKAHGHYRTKDTILEIYDAMATAIASGQPYQTLLDPPPADPRVAHPPRESEIVSSE